MTAPEGEAGRARGRVMGVDAFGNLATNLPGEWLRGASMVEVGATARVAVGSRYRDVAPGEAIARVGSDGRVEIAVRDGSAAVALGAGIGTRIGLVPEAS